MDAICCICACRAKVRILRLLTHRSVVTVQEVFSDSPDYFYMVLERLTGGPVFDRIVKKVCTCGGAKFLETFLQHTPTLCMGLLLRSSPIACSCRRPFHAVGTARTW